MSLPTSSTATGPADETAPGSQVTADATPPPPDPTHTPDAVPPTDAAAAPRDSLAWVSWLRVFAITGVVVIHTVGATAVLADARTTTEGILAIVLNRGFNFAVVLFVMVS